MRPRVFISCPLALLLSCSFAGAARAAWVHDLDPFLIQFPKSFPIAGIRWYGLSYLAGFVIAWLLIRRVLRVGTQPEATLDATGTRRLEPQRAADLVINLAIGIVVGGRLGYVLFYRPELFVEFTSSPPFWGALAINKGGMASHGGMVGGTLAVYYFAWRHKVRPLFLGDLFGFGAPLGLFIGRIANFINGELYGRACSDGFPLAVKFPQELYEQTPEQMRAIMVSAPAGLREYTSDPYKFIDLLNEKVQAGYPAATQYVATLVPARHPSQLYAAAGEGLIVFVVLAMLWMKPRKAGLIGAAFCMTYAVMRIINEFFRMPDEHLRDAEFAAIGITRGQWLSVLLFVAGVVLTVIALRRPGPPMGGWRKQKRPEPTVETVG